MSDLAAALLGLLFLVTFVVGFIIGYRWGVDDARWANRWRRR